MKMYSTKGTKSKIYASLLCNQYIESIIVPIVS